MAGFIRVACRVLLSLLLVPAAPAQELRSVGVSVSDLSNPFFVRIADGVRHEVGRLSAGRAEVMVVSNSYDMATQIEQIRNFIDRGVQMIVLNAPEPVGVGAIIRKARSAGIVVVAVDVAAQGADVTVTSDNHEAGRLACEYLGERLRGVGRVVMVNGPPVSSVIERVNGCRTALAAHSGITILSDERNGGGSRAGGLAVMTALMLAYPRIDAVFAINDPSALGADLAAHHAGRDEFFIVSVDGAPSAIDMLRRPDSRVVATAAQDPQLMAMRGVRIGYRILRGEAPPAEAVRLPTPLVTRDNMADYDGWTTGNRIGE